jgi:hypothetical protein
LFGRENQFLSPWQLSWKLVISLTFAAGINVLPHERVEKPAATVKPQRKSIFWIISRTWRESRTWKKERGAAFYADARSNAARPVSLKLRFKLPLPAWNVNKEK